MTPSTGGLLAQMSPRANESRRGGLSSSGDSGVPDDFFASAPRDSANVPPVAGDLKLTDSPLRNLPSVLTERAGFPARFLVSERLVIVPSSCVSDLFANGTAKRPSSEDSSESS